MKRILYLSAVGSVGILVLAGAALLANHVDLARRVVAPAQIAQAQAQEPKQPDPPKDGMKPGDGKAHKDCGALCLKILRSHRITSSPARRRRPHKVQAS